MKIKYQVIIGGSAEKLQERVQAAINEGWCLWGGVAISEYDYYSEDRKGYTNENYNSTFAQAMILDPTNDPPEFPVNPNEQ